MGNVDIGYRAGSFAESTAASLGCNNVRIGYCTASKSLCNFSSVIIGALAGCCVCRNGYNVYIGMQAGQNNKDASATTVVGYQAQMCGVRPNYAIYIGACSGYLAQYGCNSVYIGQCTAYKGYYSRYSVGIGHRALCTCACRNCLSVSIGALASYYLHCGFYNVSLGFGAGCSSTLTRCSLYIGSCARSCFAFGSSSGWFAIFTGNEHAIGYNSVTNGTNTTTIGNSSTTKVVLCGPITKGGGSFRIVHPNPKKKSKWLNHSFVESPTAGDNIYRWTVDVCNCEHSMPLPEYYKYLNENNMAWVKPLGHFGEAYAEVDSKEENLIIKSNKDGKYNILLVGTRKDEDAAKAWNGVEEDMTESDILSNKNRIEEDVVKIN